MPFIKANVSKTITKEQQTELKSLMGKAIEMIPGKTEEYLLIEFVDNCSLWLKGSNNEPIAYIEAAIFGNESHAGYQAFTAGITEIFRKVLNISPENCYIKYEDILAWGVAGHYIDRRRFL